MHSHLNIVVSSSCIFVNLLVWTHAPFMHSAKHPKVGREGNFCSHPVHPSYTLPNTIRASYGSCFMEYYSTVLSVRCGPSSVNIDLTVHSRPDSRKSGTMLHIVDMRTTSFLIVISYYTSNKIMYVGALCIVDVRCRRMNHCTCLVVGALCMFKWLPCFALLHRKS